MSWPAVTIRADAPLGHAMALMRTHRIRHLPVLDSDGRLVGMLSDRDLRSVLGHLEGPDPGSATHPGTATVMVTTAMTADPLTVRIDTELREVARLMDDRAIGAVLILQGERVMGILTRGDIVRAFVRAGDDSRRPRPSAA
jgi:acetoin utilization protein AcuB